MPFADLLGRAGLLPEEVDLALRKRIEQGKAAVLTYNEAVPAQIRITTGFNVVAIGRAHGRLLVSIEQRTATLLHWTYREHSRNNCVFACLGGVADAHLAALPGKNLKTLADPEFAASESVINFIRVFADGWLEAHVSPEWEQYFGKNST